MSFKPIDDRQVVNRAALSNIGSPANTTVDVIFGLINGIISGLTSSAGYIAKEIPLVAGMGTTSYVVTFPMQVDTSFVIFAMFENLTDPNPQFQQMEVTSKSTTGFTVQWNMPLDTNNYILTYIVPLKSFIETEQAIGSAQNSFTYNLPFTQGSTKYPALSMLQNLVDTYPKFQTTLISSQSTTATVIDFNVPTDTANYQAVAMLNANASTDVSVSGTSATIVTPVNFNTTSYAVMATMVNVTDANPQFQPLVVTSKSNNSFVVSWNELADTSHYVLNAYMVSLTS